MTCKEKTARYRTLLEKEILSPEEREFVTTHGEYLRVAREKGRERYKNPSVKAALAQYEKAKRQKFRELSEKQDLTEDELVWLEKEKAIIERRREHSRLKDAKKRELLLKQNPTPEEIHLIQKIKEQKERFAVKRREVWAKNKELVNGKQRERRARLTPEQKLNNTKTATAYRRKRCAVDPAFLLLSKARIRAWKFLKRVDKLKTERGTGFQKHFGTTKEVFFDYMNPKLLEGMTWENYGKVWHLDHIVPLSLGGTNEERLLKLGHYRNLQPLFAADNVRKGDSMPEIWPEGVPFTREEVESWVKE